MLYRFRTYQDAVEFYHECENVKCAKHLRDQLLRASSSVALNLSEGSAQRTTTNRIRFYYMAFGSLRESQTILDLVNAPRDSKVVQLADRVAAQLYKLCRQNPP
jgi:four helix bundle protein